MPSSNPTTGLNTAARIRITSTAPVLILSNTNTGQLLTYQITAEATDVDGNVLDPQPQLYYNLLAGFDVADVSDSGLVTGLAPGQAIVQISASAFGAVPGAFTPDGRPATGVVYAEQSIQVTEGFIQPSFWYRVQSLGGNEYQIQQVPETDSTWNGTVAYVLGPPNSPSASVIGTITGTGTLNFTSASANFVLTGTDSVHNAYHTLFSNWGGGSFPVMSLRGVAGGSGTGSASSGTPS